MSIRSRRLRRNQIGILPFMGLAALCILVASMVWGLVAYGVDLRYLSPERVREFVFSFGLLAPVIYLAIYGQPLVPLPTSVMMATGGLAFGPLWGMIAAMSGATIRGCSQFLVARRFGQNAVKILLRGRSAHLNRKIRRNSFKAVLLIRLIPNVPYDMQNYALGCSRVHFGPYILATFLGMLPVCFAFVFLGHSLTDLGQFWKLFLGVVLVGVVVWMRGARAAAKRVKSIVSAKEAVQVVPDRPSRRLEHSNEAV